MTPGGPMPKELGDITLKALAAAVLVLLGAVGGQTMQAATPAPPAPQPVAGQPSPAVLEERIRGQQALLVQRLDDLKTSVDAQVAQLVQIASAAADVQAGVREQGFTVAGIRLELDAGARADAEQDKRLAQLAAELEVMRKAREGGGGQ